MAERKRLSFFSDDCSIVNDLLVEMYRSLKTKGLQKNSLNTNRWRNQQQHMIDCIKNKKRKKYINVLVNTPYSAL